MRRLRVLDWLAIAVASAALSVVLLPGGFWRHPEVDRIYSGFDSRLTTVTEQTFPLPGAGHAGIEQGRLSISTISASQPTVQLLTTTLSHIAASFDFTVYEAPAATIPLRLELWDPRAKAGYRLWFGPAPGYEIRTQAVRDGQAAQTLVGGQTVFDHLIGTYAPGQAYHVVADMNRESGRLTWEVQAVDPPAAGVLALRGGPADPTYGDLASPLVPVIPLHAYDYGASIQLIGGSDAYKVWLAWLDSRHRLIVGENDWRPAADLGPSFTDIRFHTVAPAGAQYARLSLGSGNGTFLRFQNPFLVDGVTGVNLLPELSVRGPAAWSEDGPDPGRATVSIIDSGIQRDSAGRDELPELFGASRLSLTASASSLHGSSEVVLSNWKQVLWHQAYWADQASDPLARGSVLLIAGLALGLLLIRLLVAGRADRQALRDARYRAWRLNQARSVVYVLGVGLMVSLAFVLATGVFASSAHPFDMGSARIWMYTAAVYGPQDLYFLPNTVSLAAIWGGAPYHEAVFPYPPVMAYLFAVDGGIYHILSSALAFSPDDVALSTLVAKAVNTVFFVADGWLIYRIGLRLGLSRRVGGVIAALFLLNPALWFSVGVWGQNHVVSIFLVLIALWAVEADRPAVSWLALLAGALTRPQMFVISALLAILMLVRFPWRRNLLALAWGGVALFAVLAPMLYLVSPSMPVDVVINTFRIQEFGGEPVQISQDNYTLWVLLSGMFGSHGLARLYIPASTPLGSLTYQQLAQLLTLLWLALAGLGIVWTVRRGRDHLAAVAFGTVGFLVTMTGLVATHYVLAIPLLLLAWRSLRGPLTVAAVSVWSATCLISMYGDLAQTFTHLAGLPVALDPSNSVLTRLIVQVYMNDWMITSAALANLATLVLLGLIVLVARRLRPRVQASSLSRRETDPGPVA